MAAGMYVNGSAAEQLYNEAEVLQHEEQREAERQFVVVPGSRGKSVPVPDGSLSPIVVTAIKCAVALAAVISVICIARVFIVGMAYGVIAENAQILIQLDEARSAGSELEVQQSIYGNAERIRSIATDVYGMAPAQGSEVLDVSSAAAADGATADTGDGSAPAASME